MSHVLSSPPPMFASADGALPAGIMGAIVRQGLGSLLLGSYATLCLYTFECLFMLRVSGSLLEPTAQLRLLTAARGCRLSSRTSGSTACA
jgi:hypothetical protein